MQLQVLQEDLSKAVNTAIRFVSTRPSLPVLSNFLLIAEKTKLKIQATNLEMSITINLGAKIEKEGSVTVPAKTFLEIISNLNIGKLNLALNKEELKIENNSFSANLLTIPPNDFPKIPENLNEDESFTLPSKAFLSSLSKVLFSVSDDESRPVLTGVLFIFSENRLSLVSSDGFRLSKKNISLPGKIALKNEQIIIPKSSLLELVKIAKDVETLSFELRKVDNQLVIKVGEILISTRLIEGNFPDFEKIIPVATTTKVSVDKIDLNRAVKLSGIFAREESNIIKMKIKENLVEIASENPKAGKNVSKVEAKVEGGNLDISYNFKFVEDFLNMAEGEDIEMRFTDSVSPTIFIDPKDPDFLHIIMPVRVQS